MGKVEKIEQDVQALSPDELAELRAWSLEYDWAAWDRARYERFAQRISETTHSVLRSSENTTTS